MEFVNVKGVPWFALALFWFFLVSMLIDKVHPAYILAVSFALGLIVGYTKLLNTFALQKTIVYFPFFYLGYLSDVEKIDAFLTLLEGHEVLELARTGIAGLGRGIENVTYLD